MISTLEGWVHAMDLRDKETEGHSRRVAEITVKLASRLEVRNTELEHIRRGALLHDIGKMGIPDSILLKTWAIIRRRVEYYAEASNICIGNAFFHRIFTEISWISLNTTMNSGMVRGIQMD